MTKKKLQKLTPEQEALISVVRGEWINRLASGAEINRDAAKSSIAWLYAAAKLKPPLTIFVDSPLGAQYAAQTLRVLFTDLAQVRAQVWDQVWAQVEVQVWAQVEAQVEAQVWDQVEAQVRAQVRAQVGGQVRVQVWAQVEAQVEAQVWAQVWDQVEAQVRAQVRAQVGGQVWAQVRVQVRDQVRVQVRDQVRDQVGDHCESFCYYGSISDYGWVSFYDFFERIGIVAHADFDAFCALLESHVYDMVQLDGACVVCGLPSLLALDEEHRMHSLTGPAIAWRDGYELYYLWGIHFAKDLWGKITQKTLPVKELLALDNTEQRMAGLKVYGAEACLEGANAKLLDSSPRGNELYVLKGLFSEPQYALKYKCPSTGRVYVSFVPPEVGIDGKADAAMAWKFGLDADEYAGLRVEA